MEMEANDAVFNSYYTQPPPHQQPPPQLDGISPPSSVNGALSSKKRGRPRKYATPEEAAAARRAQLAAQPKKVKPPPPPPAVSFPEPVNAISFGGMQRQFGAGSAFAAPPLSACGNVGQGFTPHIISVAAGEDVYQKIMLFMQQSKREICIVSASGSVTSPFLRQPATSGGNVTYEGRFDIITLSGSYIRTDLGGRTGGISVCLSSVDGQIIGGGIGGPLRAAGPVDVIVGTFLIDKKDLVSGVKGIEQMV